MLIRPIIDSESRIGDSLRIEGDVACLVAGGRVCGGELDAEFVLTVGRLLSGVELLCLQLFWQAVLLVRVVYLQLDLFGLTAEACSLALGICLYVCEPQRAVSKKLNKSREAPAVSERAPLLVNSATDTQSRHSLSSSYKAGKSRLLLWSQNPFPQNQGICIGIWKLALFSKLNEACDTWPVCICNHIGPLKQFSKYTPAGD